MMAQASDRIGCLFTGWGSIWSDGLVVRDGYSARCDGKGFKRLNSCDSANFGRSE
jgi:hypothetical protein